MTVLEICSSLTEPEMEDRIAPLQNCISRIVNHSYTHRARLLMPLINVDTSGLAISFVPATGEALDRNSPRKAEDDLYTYHHLRRDIYQMVTDMGIEAKSRYVTPSAHITIARFMTNDDFLSKSSRGKDDAQRENLCLDSGRVQALVARVEQLNTWLKDEYWPRDTSGKAKGAGEWYVGEENGLVFVKGLAWYGKGTEVMAGRAF